MHRTRLLLNEDPPAIVGLPPAGATGRTPSSEAAETMATFDSSMAVTMLVLLTALFLMAFFSLYIRRFAHSDAAAEQSERTHSRGLRVTSLFGPPPHAAADPAVVAALPVFAYPHNAKLEECAVCLAEFKPGEAVKVIPACGHCFHRECIDEWLVWRCSCPLCRTTRMLVAAAATPGKEGVEVCVDVFDEMPEREFSGEEHPEGGLRRASSSASFGEGSPGSHRRSCSF